MVDDNVLDEVKSLTLASGFRGKRYLWNAHIKLRGLIAIAAALLALSSSLVFLRKLYWAQ